MKTKFISAPIVALIATFAFSQGAMSDSPNKKNPVSGQEIISIYNGKTWVWSKGGSYWGGGGKFEAIWEDKAVGIGKWYATSKGSLCYEATWKSEAGDGGAEIKRCWKHVKDSDGVLWKQDPETKDWYKPAKEIEERVKSGNKIKSEVRKRRKKVGL